MRARAGGVIGALGCSARGDIAAAPSTTAPAARGEHGAGGLVSQVLCRSVWWWWWRRACEHLQVDVKRSARVRVVASADPDADDDDAFDDFSDFPEMRTLLSN